MADKRLLLAAATLFALSQISGAAAQPVSYEVLIASPYEAPRIFDCTEDMSGDPSQPDVDQLTANGQWFIGLDLGAHQAAHKLVCSELAQGQ